MAVPYRISGMYERLLVNFEDVALRANAGTVHYQRCATSCFSRSASAIEFECYLVLMGWPWRAGTTTERVNIVLQAQEAMSTNASSLTRSTVRVSYFAQQDETVEFLHSMHFDFGIPPQQCHPLFHAQVSDEPIVPPDDVLRELDCDLLIPQQKGRCFKNARIPTSDMTLSSVLLCIAADHLPIEYFAEFRGMIEECESEFAQPTFDPLQESWQRNRRFRSVHWFAHTP